MPRPSGSGSDVEMIEHRVEMIFKKESKPSEPRLSASPGSAGATGQWVPPVSWPISLARRHHHLVQPGQAELGCAQLPAVDAAQPQEVEDNG